jgi:hypothetical protein
LPERKLQTKPFFKNNSSNQTKNIYNSFSSSTQTYIIKEEQMIPVEPNEALSPSERRTSDRKKLIVDVKFDGGDATGIANTRDIGVGGLYMTTNAQLENGMPIAMRITVGGREVAIEGVVAYIDPGQGVGVRFQNLSDDDKNLLVKELDLE